MMDAQTQKRKHEAALVALLDDPSPAVQKALTEEFARLGPARLQFLRAISNDSNHPCKAAAARQLEALMGPAPSQHLIRFIHSGQHELETGMYLINRVLAPEVELPAISGRLDALAGRCKELMVKPATIRQQCKMINRVLFHECSFRGNTEDYENPLNSCLDAVLQRRQGLPITLSVIYLLVARRLGIDLQPIGLPGHFMVGHLGASDPFFLDPFERGRVRSPMELREYLLLRNVIAQPSQLEPVPVSEVLCRVCRNLALHFESRREPRWANRFRAFVREFDKVHGQQLDG
jgi:regulator of sirC expression with transglutaminase-like and TPR domain